MVFHTDAWQVHSTRKAQQDESPFTYQGTVFLHFPLVHTLTRL
jgi:hypothetical protein